MKSRIQVFQLIAILSLVFLTLISTNAQEIKRPPIWGIAKMTFLVSDFKLARDYYGNFLGFSEAFNYNSPLGKVISFKVNDRQFLEFVEDPKAKEKTRLVSVSFETDNVEQMRQFLKNNGLKVPDAVSADGAGNEVILVRDASGNPVEFINMKQEGLHRKSKGKYLSDRRISTRMHHAGLYTSAVADNDPFYIGILKFNVMWRYPEDLNEKPFMVYLQIPECAESIEHYTSPDPNFSHPCFLVNDMQETIYTLKERSGGTNLAKPIVGKGKRWLLNLSNADKTKVEFTEAFTVR